MPELDLKSQPLEKVETILRQHRGLLPVSFQIDGDRREITWLDFRDFHLQEAFFETSVDKLRQSQLNILHMVTELDVLEKGDLFDDVLFPAGFIFQIGRCGSTLLAKMLSRVERHIVIKEAPPVQNLLGVEYEEIFSEKRPLYLQTLIKGYGRRRQPEQTHFFIKFSSNHIKRLKLIRDLYPDVPWLFLYRDPYEIIPTSLTGPAWNIRNKDTLQGAFEAALPIEKVKQMSEVAFSTQIRISSFRIALENMCNTCLFVDYAQLKPENVEKILHFFGLEVSEDELAAMVEQFGYYSKNDAESVTFVQDNARKRDEITDEIRQAIEGKLWDLYIALQGSERNLCQVYASE